MVSTTTQLAAYRLNTALRSLVAIYRLPQQKIDAFLKSYELFDKECIEENDEKNIINYYSVLNLLCSIGEVEKMYIPAVIDATKGVYANQVLFERKMAKDLNIKPGDKVLDMGCGRGRVAAHVAAITKAEVHGFNIDDVQLESAKKFAKINALTGRCKFLKANLNDAFPFDDASFDALYQIQVLTYAKDKEKVFAEMFRVLKPGAKLSFLDWVQLDGYDASNAHHRSLVARVKPLIGAIDTPTPHEIKEKLENVGFRVLSSQDASVNGHQAVLIENADKFYNRAKKIINILVTCKLLPAHFNVLFERLTKHGEAFIEADSLGLVTTSFQTIAEKPRLS